MEYIEKDYDYKNINEIIEPGYAVIRLPVTPVGMSRFVTYIKLKNLANKRSIVEMFAISREDANDLETTKEKMSLQDIMKKLNPRKEERVFVDIIESTCISETPTTLKEEKILFHHSYKKLLVIKSDTRCVLFMLCYYR